MRGWKAVEYAVTAAFLAALAVLFFTAIGGSVAEVTGTINDALNAR